MVADTHGGLQHRQGEGLHAIAQQPHVLPLSGKELKGGRLAVDPRRELVVQTLHHHLKVALTVPEGVIGIEGDDTYFLSIHSILLHRC